jgi:hypothetical protein
MRTTVNLPDDVYQAARATAALERISLGEALAALARAGMRPPAVIDAGGDFPCFELPPGAGPVTLERTLEIEDEL